MAGRELAPAAELEKRPSKYSEFKPMVSTKTPESMMQNHATNEDPHYAKAGGVVPGYQGHVPRSRDAFGVTAVGGLAPDPNVGAHKKMGPMKGHEPDAVVLGREPAEQQLLHYRDKKGGYMPGYAGFRPGAREHHNTSAFGGIPLVGPEGQGKDLKQTWSATSMDEGVEYSQKLNGLVPGYKGYVPQSQAKVGRSHMGNLPPSAGAQSGHEQSGLAHDKAFEVSKMAKSGYSGHLRGARDTYGTSVYNPE